MSAQALRHMLDDGTHLGALGRARRAQNRRDRSAARNVIDVHRCKTALVVMRVPERKLCRHAPRRTCRQCRGPPVCPASRSCRTDQAEPQIAAPPRSCSAHSPDERWSIATPALPRFPDSGRPRPSSKDHAAAGRGRWRPRSRTRSPTRAPSPSRTSRAGRGPDRGDPASLPQAAGTPRAGAPPLATAANRHPTD